MKSHLHRSRPGHCFLFLLLFPNNISINRKRERRTAARGSSRRSVCPTTERYGLAWGAGSEVGCGQRSVGRLGQKGQGEAWGGVGRQVCSGHLGRLGSDLLERPAPRLPGQLVGEEAAQVPTCLGAV